ncbi:alpha-amylase family glycosyl hydrolase [Mycoplasmopsis bovirhinis]|uniref:Alpha-amylase n=1 Tax=Mycoplasmopsis bovirhinis TaxID=29553 RepID=A0A449ADN1_9BACT|nr:alpha-amylase family glycosyl hydrolase [Mycoplasmopsis bovirhinis]VEU63091.1 Alpha-amylase [Mycoplasmopsis bovirhinis]
MKKSLKKILSFSLVATSFFSLVSCTQNPPTETKPIVSNPPQTSVNPPTNSAKTNPNPVLKTKDTKNQNLKKQLNWGDESFAKLVRTNNLTNLSYKDEANNVQSIAPFNKEAKRSNVMYQLTVYSFADGNNDGIGDFIGLKNNLDYFVNLGIDTLYLSPIHPASSYHGYDVIDYTDVAPELGGMVAFDEFLTQAHAKGIRVVIDMVLNHTSYEHPWFQKALQGDPKYQNYYYMYENNSQKLPKEGTDDIRQNFVYINTPGQNFANTNYKWAAEFWSGMPDLNLKNPELLQEMLNIHKFWAKKGIDGFRYDAFYHFFDSENIYKNTSRKGLEVDLMAQFRKVIEQEYQNSQTNNIARSSNEAFMFGEWWGNSYDEKAKSNWFDKIGQKALSSLIDGSKWKDDVNYVWIHPGDELNLIKALTDSKGQKREWIPFLDNHDVERWINKYKYQEKQTPVDTNPHKLTDKERFRYLSALFSLLSRGGLPTLYNGNEILMQGGPKTDDTNVREAFNWADQSKNVFFKEAKNDAVSIKPGASVAEGTIESLVNDPNSSYNLIAKLIKLRQQYISLRKMDEKYIWWDLPKVLEFQTKESDFKEQNITLRLNDDNTMILIIYSDSLENESEISLNPSYTIKEKLFGDNFTSYTQGTKQTIKATGKGKFGAFLIAPK